MVGNIQRQIKGFTLVEITIVIAVIALITTIVISSMSGSQEKTYFTKAQTDLANISGAVQLYANKYNAYPTDVAKGIPASLVEFIDAPQGVDLIDGPWPGSNYDYEIWDLDTDGVKETITISVRFCPPDGDSTPISNCKFPKQSWATNFNNYSSVYYCVKGFCRSHFQALYTNPGYCLNCPGNTGIAPPTP